ncbi:peroxidase isoform X2 [Parasteatoda tepidariorum]|uniref:peroxidase isoform X2 n=1 Tax=Parasteatoda tepidariorum TaxID=114398 RepID=UPI00077FA08B|nr:peroxidase isoform X2 [Parasteatoda tepidariorum]
MIENWRLLLRLTLMICTFKVTYGQSSVITPRYAILQRTHYEWLPQITDYDMDQAFVVAEHVIKAKRAHEKKIFKTGRIMKPGHFPSSGRHQHLLAPNAKASKMERATEKFEEATNVIKDMFSLTKEQVTLALPHEELKGREALKAAGECHGHFSDSSCLDSKYRSIDGSCNNLYNPTWGKGQTCLQRLLPPDYADGISVPRMSKSAKPLPPPRVLSLYIHRHMDRPAHDHTHFLMVFGQFVDHDITLTPITGGPQMINCCPHSNDTHPQCFPVLLPQDDPFYSKYGQDCLNFVRSAPCPLCTLGPRQQMDQVTAFVDLSLIYGTQENETEGLRTFRGGKLIVTKVPHTGDLLPQTENPKEDQCSVPQRNLFCFRSGDVRVNQHPALTSLTTIWVRQHNRIAEGLQVVNPHWDDDTLFWETRRILGGQMQKVVFGEYLPTVLGSHYMDFYSLWVLESGFTQYNSKMEPTMINEFSTAAYRYGHSLIDGLFSEIQEHSGHISGIMLRNYFFFPFELYDGQLDPLMKGLTLQPSQKMDPYFVPDVRNFLYRRRGNSTGLDLAAFNIQRGRDHGVQGYTSYIQYCFGVEVKKFEDLDRFMTPERRKKLQDIYHSVHDIDLYTGGTSESHVPEGVVGPTFACIIGIQFYHLKFGDRYYFEHHGETGSFSLEQLESIKKSPLAKIVCENTHLHEIQQYAFRFPSTANPVTHCSELPDIDLSLWADYGHKKKK